MTTERENELYDLINAIETNGVNFMEWDGEALLFIGHGTEKQIIQSTMNELGETGEVYVMGWLGACKVVLNEKSA